ncbi:MAG: hypothetical protein BM564_12490 [Bacteroidetes bacterium MedPE-SWsnd-G2]|nr:MAG: hypothetical protein BM564_12490 [Bacteroidetes bacterium MedPE-SWsnd-G2]
MLSFVSLNGQNQNGIKSFTTTTKHGQITINMPSNLNSGDVISGTVRTEPKGSNSNQKAKAIKQLKKYTIDLNGTLWSSNTSPQQLTLPTAPSITILVLDPNGNTVYSKLMAVNPTVSNASSTAIQTPTFFRSGYPNAIKGPFDGIASNTQVLLNNQPLDILTESLNEMVCELPDNSSGLQQLTIKDNGSTLAETVHVINLELSVDQLHLNQGESTQLHVTVLGLEGLDTPVSYDIENQSPNSVHLGGGVYQHMVITKDMITADGTFTKAYSLKALKTGGFSISCQLLPPPPRDQQLDRSASDHFALENPTPTLSPINFTNPEYEIHPDNSSQLINYTQGEALPQYTIIIPEGDIKRERNKSRKIPSGTTLAPRDPDDKDKPYSRPIPTGIKGDKGYTVKHGPTVRNY